MPARRFAIFVLVLFSQPVIGYEWLSHNRMSFNARQVLLIKVAADPELRAFLQDRDHDGYGNDIDTRAGDQAENAWTDEDHNEGELSEVPGLCVYRERDCGEKAGYLNKEFGALPCSFSHFQPKLAIPLGQKEAIEHASEYFDLAVRLYKAAKCDSRGLAPVYYKWSARALGHAIHLVEDMGSPQHSLPENHAPYPIGHGKSFHEYWSLDVWGINDRRNYTMPDGGGTVPVGGFEQAAAGASEPRRGTLEQVMLGIAAESRSFLNGAPYARGSNLLLKELLRVFSGSNLNPNWQVTQADKGGAPLEWSLASFSARSFPTYGFGLPDDGRHGYATSLWLAEPDYRESEGMWFPDTGRVTLSSFELAERLWAQVDAEHPDNPIELDKKLNDLLQHTTEAAAGAILAFWDEVKDYTCPCYGFTPCAFRAGSKDPDCDTPKPGPYTPGGDNPDDTQGIVSNVSAVKTASVSQFDSVELGRHWRQIAAMGVEKGLSSLVDFGRTMGLLELAQDQTLTDAGMDEIARGMAELERKYTVNRPRPEDDMGKAAHIGVLQNGFAGEAASALDALGWTHLTVPITFDPLQLAEDQKVLLIPSGGLYGTSGSVDLKERLRAFVDAGGTLIVLAQMLGDDFQTVPAPAGEVLKAYGWFEDQSCWTGSVRIVSAHPVTAALASGGRSVALDGYLEQWPSGATVLLRKTNGGMPALLAYPLGAGWVAVGTIFSDWARGNGRSSAEDEGLLASLLRWGIDPGRERPVCHSGAPCTVTLPVTLRNLTESPADTIVWQVLDGRQRAVLRWSEQRPLAAGEVVTQNLNISSPSFEPGILTLIYRLEDSTRTIEVKPFSGANKPWVVQPDGAAGQLVVENWPEEVAQAPEIGVGLAVDSEYVLDGSSIPVHLSLRNFGTEPFSGVVKLSTWAKWFPEVQVAVAPDSLSTYDLSVGPVHLTTGHDGLPGGGFIRAEVYSMTGDGPLATAVKNLLYDPKLFDISLQASEATAGPGDELHFFGAITNHSMGEVNARYRMTFTNFYSTTGVRCPETKTDWRDLHLGRDESFSLDEPYTVPKGCNGLIDATLHLCYPGHQCWQSGNEANASHRNVQVGLPNTVIELGFGEFTVVDGPAFRLPVRVSNIGERAVEDGQIGVGYWNPQGPEVHSALFNLGRGEETTVTLDLPLPEGRMLDHYVLMAAFRDKYRAVEEEEVARWPFRTYHDLYYGGGISAINGFSAVPGSEAVSGTVRIENRSSTTRHFLVTFDQTDLSFHQQRELDIGPFQKAAITLSVPLPSAQTYGAWPMQVTATDGALLNVQRPINLIHSKPYVQIASRPSAPSFRAGEIVTVSVELKPGQLARPLPGTLELACDRLEFTENRSLSLASLQTATETFSIQVPPDSPDGVVAYRVRWSGSDGTVAQNEGSFIVPPARFEVRSLQQQEVTAGDTIAYEVRNVGGASVGMYVFEWKLLGERGWLAQESRPLSAPFDQLQQLTFSIPPDIAAGSYWSVLEYSSAGERASHSEKLQIAGVASGLDVGTGAPVYAYGQPIDGWAKVTNGAQAFPNASLTLKVLAPHLCTARILPWGVFQGSGSRQGAAPVGGASLPPPLLQPCFGIAASLPAGVSPIAVAAADVNEDGTDDVVAVWRAGAGLWLGVFAGPNLAQYSSAQLQGNASAAALGVADADGDGHLEIFEADTGDGSSLVVRSFDRALRKRWETSTAIAIDAGTAFPAGGPIFADLQGDGGLSLLVSSGRDVLAFDVADGTIRWRMLDANPSLDGRLVTGIAAADADGDGRGEVAVGFRAPGAPASGAVALLDGAGTARWSQATAHPVAGSPVLVPSGRIAVVETPESSAASSTLMLLDSATGSIAVQTTTPFWSGFPPAAADTNGDGASELAVASGDPACATCAPRAVLLFNAQGSLLWSASMAQPLLTPPAMVDMDGDTRPDVMTGYLWSQIRNGLACFRGSDGVLLANAAVPSDPSSLPLYVLDVNGDCLPDILSGKDVLRGASCAGPGRLASKLSPQAQGEVVWRWEGSSTLAPEQVWDVPQQLSTNQRTGFFYLVGDLKNSLGQLIGHDESTFSVQWGTVLLNLEPFPQACRSGSELQATGTVRNAGTAARTIDLVFLLDNVEFARRQFTLAAGESQPFSETLGAGGTGTHTLAINATAGTSWLQGLTQQFQVEEPAVRVTVSGPAKVGQEAFELKAEVANLTQLPLELDVGLDIPDQPPTQREHVTLAGADKTSLVLRRQVSTDTTFVARVSGDATAEEPFAVEYDVELEPVYIGSAGLPVGSAVLCLELANAGGHPWRGELLWSLAGTTNTSGNIATEVGPASSQKLDIPVTLVPGTSILRLEAGGVVREFPVAASTGGHGLLTLAVPAQAVEGDVAIPVRVANSLPAAGSFQVDLEVRDYDSGEQVTTEHLVWNLDGDQTAEETIPLSIAAGRYQLIPWLNGIVVGEAPHSFEVVPRYAAELTATVEAAQADGTLPLVVAVRNGGAREVTGTLTINGLGDPIVTPDFGAAVGGTTQITVLIEPDLLPAGDVPIEVVYTTGTGQVLASQQVVVSVLPPAPAVVAAPQSIEAPAGSVAPVEFVVANTGTQTATFELALTVNGGSLFSGQQEGRLRGGQQEAVRFDVPLPADLPSGRVEAVYTLIQIDPATEQGQTVGTGRLWLSVQGAPVTVTAQVDRDHVTAGGTVVLTLTLEASQLTTPLPLFAQASYPPFDERREFELGPSGTQISFEVPIEQPGAELGYGIHFTSGRALHLDALTIHPAGGPVEIAASEREYKPGEQVQLAVTLNKPGVFEGYGFEQAASLSASGSATFQIPAGVPRGRYPILWTFYGSGPDGGVLNGEYPVKVRGPLVRITRVQATRPADLSDQEALVQAVVTTDTPMSTMLKAWLVGPSGQAAFMGETPLDLEAGEFREAALRLDLSGAEAGTQSCVVGVYGQDGTLLADAAAQLDLGDGRVLGVRTDKAFYAGAGDTVTALVDTQGSGSGTLALRVDGKVAITRSVVLTGVQRIAVFVPGPGAGRHDLEAVLDAGGRSSSASTSFSVGTMLPDLAVDLGGAQIESGAVRVVARVRNVGQSDSPATDLTLWDGEPGLGTLVSELAVGALAPGTDAFVPTEITLTEGQHQVTGWVDRSGHIEEFDRSNNIARFDLVVGPGAQPPPPPSGYVVQAASRSYRMGDSVLIEGQAPDGTYCAAVVHNGVWTIGAPAPSGILSSVTVTASGGVIPPTQIWVATALGSYDVLLISGACGTGGTIVAASDPGVASGFDVTADPIPVTSGLGLFLLIALIALLGIWVLATRRV
jgi:hypothetical protein